jgi:hypothetical protein
MSFNFIKAVESASWAYSLPKAHQPEKSERQLLMRVGLYNTITKVAIR